MDGQNFENENVTVDTTATEVASEVDTTAQEAQETLETEQPVNNYQDNTAAYNSAAQPQYTAPVQPVKNETNALAIVSLVLGILAIVLGCCSGWLGILFGIGGIVCSVLGNKQSPSGIGKAGLICSIIGLVLGVLMFALVIILSVLGAAGDFARYY